MQPIERPHAELRIERAYDPRVNVEAKQRLPLDAQPARRWRWGSRRRPRCRPAPCGPGSRDHVVALGCRKAVLTVEQADELHSAGGLAHLGDAAPVSGPPSCTTQTSLGATALNEPRTTIAAIRSTRPPQIEATIRRLPMSYCTRSVIVSLRTRRRSRHLRTHRRHYRRPRTSPSPGPQRPRVERRGPSRSPDR